MPLPTRIEILRLYKDLLRYGRELKYTDQKYYYKRIRKEFLDHKEAKEEKLEFVYKFFKGLCYPSRFKSCIDKSKVPVLNNHELEYKFVKGSGPGGSNVNKSVNCVCLTHKPTGIVIKCHEDRSLQRNIVLARERLIMKLDNLYNGEDSIENQKKRLLQKRSQDQQRKRNRLLALREKYKNNNNENKN